MSAANTVENRQQGARLSPMTATNSKLARRWMAVGNGIAWVLIALVALLARLLSRTNLGALLHSVSLSRMRQQPLRTSAGALGIALGVAVLAAVTIVNHSVMMGVRATIGDLAGKADLQVTAGSSGFLESVLDQVRDVPGVYTTTPITEQIASAFGPDGKRERLLVMGVDLIGSEDAYFRNYAPADMEAIRREQVAFLNSTNNIILGREVADRLGLKLHDKLRIAVGNGVQEFEIWGLVSLEGVGRAFGGAFAMMYYPAMQEAFARGRNIDRIDVAIVPGASVTQVASALRQRLGPGFTVDRPARRTDRIMKMLLAVRVGLIMASLSALLAGGFLVFNTSAIAVIQRRRELGVMRALGTTRSQLVRLLTLEAVLVGSVGSALGVLLGILISGVMLHWTTGVVSKLYVQQGVTDLHIDPIPLLVTFVLGVLCTAIAARVASRHASNVQPVEALSSARSRFFTVPAHGVSKMEMVGVVMLLVTAPLLALPVIDNIPFGPLAATVTWVIGVQAFVPRVLLATRRLWSGPARGMLGASTALAIDGVYRDVGRSSAMASGVIAAVGLVVSISAFVASFMSSLNDWAVRSLPGDLLVTSGAVTGALSSRNTPMSDALGGELLSIPGVTRARRIRTVDLEYSGRTVKLLSTDMGMFARTASATTIEGDSVDVVQQIEHGAVAVSENFARYFDVHRGDQLALSTKNGMRHFKVAGVIVDYTSDLGTILLDRTTYIENWADERVDTYELYLAPGVRADAVRSEINDRLGERYDLFVLTNSEFRAEIVKSASEVFSLMRVLEFVTLLVAAVGLMTTVLANVMDRVREIGVYRAIGMLSRQVAKMVMLESIFIGYLGAVIGIVVGAATGYIMSVHVMTVELGWLLPFRLPAIVLAEMLLLLPFAAALAGYFPARKAAGLELREALEYQ